jgi:peptide-methionine (S)-S-oxide reductase
MKKFKIIMPASIAVLMLVALAAQAFSSGSTEKKEPEKTMERQMMSDEDFEGMETAVFAGGCFWGVEGVFEMLDGVSDVVSGYSGGDADTAHYQMVGTGKTGHAEAVSIKYDPRYITYEKLLEIFFSVAHDPTQLNYQGPDVGTEYRSAIFYKNEEQKKSAEMYIIKLEKDKVYKKPVVTELTALDAFYPAEEYHQNFLKLNPAHPYIVYWDMPKIRDLEQKYPELIDGK